MNPTSRSFVNKGKSARQFKGNVSTTKSANTAGSPMRGGWRF